MRVLEGTTFPARNLPRLLLAALALPALLAVPCGAQTATEGYDPLRQITVQQDKANLLIVLDTSGSMRWDAERHALSNVTSNPTTYTPPNPFNNTGLLAWNSGCGYVACTDYVTTAKIPGNAWGKGWATAIPTSIGQTGACLLYTSPSPRDS